MIRPVRTFTRISTQFGATPDPGVFGKHAGTDYACPVGTPIYAPISGKVTQSFDGPTAGGQVEITDSTYSTRTLHMSRQDVAVGDRVSEGQQVGLSGDTGTKTTGPHCHWDIRKAGTAWDHSFNDYFDPEQLMKGADVSTVGEFEFHIKYEAYFGPMERNQPSAADRSRWIGAESNTVDREMEADPRHAAWLQYVADLEKSAGAANVSKQTVLDYVNKHLN